MKSLFCCLLLCFIAKISFGQNPFPIPFISVNVNATTIKYDDKRDKIYATIKGLDSLYGNKLVKINPYTGVIENSVFVGSEPNRMAITKDTNYVYVTLNGANVLKRVDLNTFTVDRTISLGSDPFLGPYFAQDIATSNLSPDLVIIARGLNPSISSVNQNIAANYNNTFLPGQSSYYLGTVLQSPHDTNLVFSYDGGLSSHAVNRMKVDTQTGITVLSTSNMQNMSFGVEIKLADNLLYANQGSIIDPYANPIGLAGTFSTPTFNTQSEPDAPNNHVFFASASYNTLNIKRYNLQTQTLIDETPVPIDSGTFFSPDVKNMIRYGTHGLGFVVLNDGSSPTLENTRIILLETCIVKEGTDIAAYLSYNPASIYLADTNNITLVIKNNGNNTANNVIVTDTFNTTFNVFNASSSSGTTQINNGIFTWSAGNLLPGQSDTAMFSIVAGQTGFIPNHLSARANEFDCNSLDNELINPIEVRDTACANLIIDFPNADTVYPIGYHSFYWRITNAGTVKARHIKMIDTLDSRIQINSVSVIAGNVTNTGNVVTYTTDTLDPGQSVIVNINTQMNQTGEYNDSIYFFADNILCNPRLLYDTAFKVVPTLSIHTIAGNNAINIYPNPAKDHITIESGKKLDLVCLSIYNMTGQEVRHENINAKDKATISLKGLPSGIYTLRLMTNQGTVIKKLEIIR